MAENQEKELFNILGRLVDGVSEVQADIREIKATLAQHSDLLTEHPAKHDEHLRDFGRIDSKLDSIALQVIENGKRHTARLEAVESTV